MGITVSTIAASRRLTTRTAVRAELGAALAPATDDALLDTLIDQASGAIRSYCHWDAFGREILTETLPGFGDIHLQLRRTPVVKVSTVTDINSTIYTDYAVAEPNRGWLYRRAGWSWSAQTFPGLGASGSFLDNGYPMARQEEPYFSVAYTAGYILPEQHLVGATTLSADASDDSFNDSASGFPGTLVAGDIVQSSGWANAGNNGLFVVSGTPTAAKIVVSASLTTEAAAVDKNRTMRFLPPANVRPLDDLEKAAIETVKSWYQRRKDDADVVEKQVGQLRIRRSEADNARTLGLPPSAIGLLRPWVRAA